MLKLIIGPFMASILTLAVVRPAIGRDDREPHSHNRPAQPAPVAIHHPPPKARANEVEGPKPQVEERSSPPDA